MGIFSRKKTDTSAPAVQPAETKATQSVAKTAAKKVAKTVSKPVAKVVLLQPIITEKSTANGTYVFKVSKAATKNEVRKAFQAKYGKQPRKVNVVNVMGKTKFRGNQTGKRADWKKAVVYLTKGESVDLFQ
jgi:large subunit ribosomal protein L23